VLFHSERDYSNPIAHINKLLHERAATAFLFSTLKEGVSQTASVLSPYIYAEENWRDD
jgi:hypothetical protein